MMKHVRDTGVAGKRSLTMTRKGYVLIGAISALLLGAFLTLASNAPKLAALAPHLFAHPGWALLPGALPHLGTAALGLIVLFGSKGSPNVRRIAGGVMLGTLAPLIVSIVLALWQPAIVQAVVPPALVRQDGGARVGMIITLLVALLALRIVVLGNGGFGTIGPTRLTGRRAVHGESTWMSKTAARALFPQTGGIVIGEASRPDQELIGDVKFDPRRKHTWGRGGRASLLCFDASFGSTHGLVFAGSGGFKTTSTVIPTALKFKGTLVVLDPSTEVAPMVSAHRQKHGQTVFTLDPNAPRIGFNVLDWIGLNGNTPEQDIASVAAWIMSERPQLASGSDEFFRTSAQQLITAIIAYVVLRAPSKTDDDARPNERSLRTVRQVLAQPEETLKKTLGELHEETTSRFVREIVAPFVNMTPQTFSGVYGTAAKETHWLSYENYASLVSGNSFRTDEIADGACTVFINIDLFTLENHPGMARVIVGALLMAVYNRKGEMSERALFVFDEAARLGYMRILETARDAGRKYGITLVMLFQSLGQMREAFGGADATSKWFESASWVSFSAINDTDTAQYISKRCGTTTVEVTQISSTSKDMGASRTRSKQLSQRPLILSHEVTLMRADEQIVFTSGNAPLRCGRALYFRRPEMRALVGENRFAASASPRK
ncbi:Ti-type conjugative transfer system protein TraG [Pelagibacterium luteolum]